MKRIVLFLILLPLLNANASELSDILVELQKASSEIRQGLTEVKAGLNESREASIDLTQQLSALQIILSEQKDDLIAARREVDRLKITMVVGGSVLIAGVLTAIIIAFIK